MSFVSFVVIRPVNHLTITTQRDGPVEYLTLNRPDVRNAFNERAIEEIAQWTAGIRERSSDVRAVVLGGAGQVFCAGADLSWMSRMIHYTEEENLRDAMAMSRMFAALDELPMPLIGRVHGAPLGGGRALPPSAISSWPKNGPCLDSPK